MIRSDDPDAILFLQSAHKRSCAKRFRRDEAGLRVKSYDAETRWHATTAQADGVARLGELLEAASLRDDTIVVPGALTDEARCTDIPRKLHGAGASLRPVARSWLAADVDDLPAPDGSGPSHLDRVRAVWATALPPALRGVACWWQLTSQAGLSGDANTVRCRYWFWLDTPVHTDVLRAWAKTHSDTIDPAVFVCTQPIYIARPRFEGLPDPIPSGQRSGFLPGDKGAAVRVADMCLAAARDVARRRADVGTRVTRKAVEPDEAQIAARLEAIQQQVSVDARHFHALGAACELYALGAAPEQIYESLEDLFNRQGRAAKPGEIEELLAHAARKDAEGTLRTKHRPWNELLDEADALASADDTPADERALALDEIGEGEEESLTTKNSDGYNATLFLHRHYPDGGFLRWAQQDWEWSGKCWTRLENPEILKHRVDRAGGSALSDGKARSCAAKIRGFCSRERLTLPGWLNRETAEASPAIVCNNGLVFVDDAILAPHKALQPHDKNYFSTHALGFDYVPDAQCPTWLRCVDDWFLDDVASKRELQKIFGYLLVPDNKYEKFFVLTDARGRAGKGTAVQVLMWLLGPDAIGATSFTGFSKDFGLGSLVGKTVALFNEANAQNQSDVPMQAIDRIKAITGNDLVEIERKGVDSIHLKLRLRLLMSCNRMPNFRDPSGALMKRMHMVEFKQTFYGREKADLKDVSGPLYKELPGVLNWAIEGLRLLYYEDRGFVRPESVAESFQQAERLGAPIKAFMQDCLEEVNVAEEYVEKESLYRCYGTWIREKEGTRPVGREKFFAELRLLCPHRVEERKTLDGRRSRVWWGLRYSEEGAEYINTSLFST